MLSTHRVRRRPAPANPAVALTFTAWSLDSRKLARISSSSGPGVVEVWDIASARIIERWVADGAADLRYLGWGEKLIALDCLGGAVRVFAVDRAQSDSGSISTFR